MRKEILYENYSLYRDSFKVQAYIFGTGEKSVCIAGAMRGNEYQQIYTCSQIVQELKKLETEDKLTDGHKIMVIPSLNPYSMNIEKRFWPIDNTDINRMFPGYSEGETTQRIAGGIFEKIKDYTYGIQFASNYMPGEFMPHVTMMKTGLEDTKGAMEFGMPYVVVRNPRPYDTTTLNYNWQIWETHAYSLYTTATERINRESASRGVYSVLRFLASVGCVKYGRHPGYLSKIIDDSEMVVVRTEKAGLFEAAVKVEQEVKEGDLLARILNPLDGEEQARIYAPCNGILFFLHNGQLTYAHTAVCKLIPV